MPNLPKNNNIMPGIWWNGPEQWIVRQPHQFNTYNSKCIKCGLEIFHLNNFLIIDGYNIYDNIYTYDKDKAELTCEEIQIKDIIE
jgi:hypothetical protein